jgi:hypothetical protein
VGVLEWLGAHLLAPVINGVRAWLGKPRPEVQIVELVPTDGGGADVEFRLVLENRGNKQIRVTVSAAVGDEPVRCEPADVNLLYNTEPTEVRILVPRPDLGDLVAEFNHETMLYGRTLTVEVVAGKKRPTETWTEHVYSVEENPGRYRIQQARWKSPRISRRASLSSATRSRTRRS